MSKNSTTKKTAKKVTKDDRLARDRDIEKLVAHAVFTETCSLREHQIALVTLLDIICRADNGADAQNLALHARNEVFKRSTEVIDDAIDRVIDCGANVPAFQKGASA